MKTVRFVLAQFSNGWRQMIWLKPLSILLLPIASLPIAFREAVLAYRLSSPPEN